MTEEAKRVEEEGLLVELRHLRVSWVAGRSLTETRLYTAARRSQAVPRMGTSRELSAQIVKPRTFDRSISTQFSPLRGSLMVIPKSDNTNTGSYAS